MKAVINAMIFVISSKKIFRCPSAEGYEGYAFSGLCLDGTRN